MNLNTVLGLTTVLPISTERREECIFSVDVEDWFHILNAKSTPSLSTWDKLPSRVEGNLYRLLDLFSEKQVHVTCFFLGWVAERFPHLVRESAKRGHEIASHGYAHRLVYDMNPAEFYQDALHSREILEDIAGAAVVGYRSAGFSQTGRTPWFFEQLARAGYQYDASVFPAVGGHGGMRKACRTPYAIVHGTTKLIEVPRTVARVAGESMCFFGGGYLRLFPYWLIRRMARQVLNAGRPLVFYVHPREIDPTHPRLPLSSFRRFKCYVNLDETEGKILRILNEFRVTTFHSFLSRNGHRWSLPSVA